MPGPQNTPASVRAALAAGADGAEIDVRRTADGGLVCIHDPVVESRAVVTLSVAQLVALGVSTFAEVLAAGAGGRLVIEVKNAPNEPDYAPDALAARLLLAALQDRIGPPGQAPRDVLISSFDRRVCDAARDAGWPTGLLTAPWRELDSGAAAAIAAGYQELHAHVSAFTGTRMRRRLPAALAQWQAARLRVAAWTVTTPSQALALRAAGLDAVICDDPAGIVAALAAGEGGNGSRPSLPGLKAELSARMWQLERTRRRRAARRARR